MTMPLLGCDIVGHLVTAADVGLTAGTKLASGSPYDLTAIQTAGPETVLVVCRLSSGSATLTADTTADGVYSSALATKSMTGTDYHLLVFDTDATNNYVNVRVATSANCIIDRFCVLPLGNLTEGEESDSVRDGLRAFLGSHNGVTSDGSGVFTFAVSA